METDERKWKSGAGPGEEIQKGITCGTAAGAKQGRTKGNQQKAKYAESEEMFGKLGRTEEESVGDERNRSAPGKPL